MNTLAYTTSALSLNSLNFLETNGYRSRFTEEIIQFKRNYDFIGPFIIVFLYALIALPLFTFSYWLGAFVFVFLVMGIYFHKQLLSKSSTININADEKRVEINNRFGSTSLSFTQVDSVSMLS